MRNLLFVGLITEGNTDIRFLESIIKKTFDSIAFDAVGDIEIELVSITLNKTNFVEDVLTAARKGVEEYGITVLCVHTDADDINDNSVYQNKITPALNALKKDTNPDICHNLVPVVPVQMTESWMLADKDLLKKQIGSTLTDFQLGIHKAPETISDPKRTIAEAIRIARQGITQRRRSDLTISDLYLPIGQNMNLIKLELLPSYLKFKNDVVRIFKNLNYLH